MNEMTKGQIGELIDIDRVRAKKTGRGIYAEVAELINRLTNGAGAITSTDERVRQAKVLWDKGFGRELGNDSFDAYLATVPEIPNFSANYTKRFPLLVLVDARLTISKSCEFAGLRYSSDDQSLVDFGSMKPKTEKIYWMRAQDGRKNQNKSIAACRESFAKDEVGLTAMEGIALYIQNPAVIEGHYLDLPGSVYARDRDLSANLGCAGDKLRLDWCHNIHGPVPSCGSASRGEPSIVFMSGALSFP